MNPTKHLGLKPHQTKMVLSTFLICKALKTLYHRIQMIHCVSYFLLFQLTPYSCFLTGQPLISLSGKLVLSIVYRQSVQKEAWRWCQLKLLTRRKLAVPPFSCRQLEKKTAISCITLHCFSVLITYCKPYRSFKIFCRPLKVLCLNILRKKSNHSMHFFFNLACGSYLTTKMTSSMHSFPNFPWTNEVLD